MPLSELQAAILHSLAAHRNPESYVAGADDPRFSSDIDIFHDREEAVARAADADAAVLSDNGYAVRWVRHEPGKLAGYVEHAGRRGGYWPSSAEIGGAMLDRDP